MPKEYFIFGFTIKSKYDLFRYNIFTEHSIPVTTRQDDQNYVTKYIWPKIQYRLSIEEYQNYDFIHTLFMDLLKEKYD